MTDEVERVARAVRRGKFERTRRISSFDETAPPTENELDDARTAIAAMQQWQPIESAPRDGTPILLGRAKIELDGPTHWMKLPEPPK